MSFKYFCTQCGQENDADTVLFQMDHLLTNAGDKQESGNETQELTFFHWYLNEKELRALVEKGTPGKDHCYDCSLSFEELMDYMSRQDSMNDSALKTLSLQDVEDYIQMKENMFVPEAEENDDDDDDEIYSFAESLFDDEDDDPEDGGPSPNPTDFPGKNQYHAALKHIIKKSSANKDITIKETLLKDELKIIRTLFLRAEDGCYHFSIRLHFENDVEGREYLVGYKANGHIYDEARICRNSKCRKRIFRKAGYARHKLVTFIGEVSSSKTTTILSLVHYAMYGMKTATNKKEKVLWTNNPNKKINKDYTSFSVELLNKNEKNLLDDLQWFNLGVAPEKTNAISRDDVYCPTLLIENIEANRHIILSLMDLSGELFKNGMRGSQEEKIEGLFSAALSSSAYIVCLDFAEENTEINNLLTYTNKIQKMRKGVGGDDYYVPTMILFSKYDDSIFEDEQYGNVKTARHLYMFDNEKWSLDHADSESSLYGFYKAADATFRTNVMMQDCYFAMMRAGAFGKTVKLVTSDIPMQSISVRDIMHDWNSGEERGTEAEEDKAIDKKQAVEKIAQQKKLSLDDLTPTPNNIDLLMHWILYLTGCIPCDVSYTPKSGAHKILNDYYLERDSHRTENPGENGLGKDSAINEAIVRHLLFANPGYWDRLLVRSLSEEIDKKDLIDGIARKLRPNCIIGSGVQVYNRMVLEPDTNAKDN